MGILWTKSVKKHEYSYTAGTGKVKSGTIYDMTSEERKKAWGTTKHFVLSEHQKKPEKPVIFHLDR